LAAFVVIAIYYKLFGLIAACGAGANVVLTDGSSCPLCGARPDAARPHRAVCSPSVWAVDANILIYDAIREAAQLRVAARGHHRRFSTRRLSFPSQPSPIPNVTALIAGLVFLFLGCGCGARLRNGAVFVIATLDVSPL